MVNARAAPAKSSARQIPHEGHNHREVIVGSVPDANVIFRHFTENAQQIPAFGTNGLQRLGFVARGYFYFFFRFSPAGALVALMRAARDGSMPSVTLTVIPGFKSAMLAR